MDVEWRFFSDGFFHRERLGLVCMQALILDEEKNEEMEIVDGERKRHSKK